MDSDLDRPSPSDEASPCSYTEYDTRDRADGDVPATGDEAEGLEREVWAALYGIEDPEMPVSIVDLGLIYGVDLADEHATVDMTLTYSGCPARELLLDEVERTVADVDGIGEAEIRLVWSPDWTVDLVTESGKEALREFGLSFE